jgi:hypothetical protein
MVVRPTRLGLQDRLVAVSHATGRHDGCHKRGHALIMPDLAVTADLRLRTWSRRRRESDLWSLTHSTWRYSARQERTGWTTHPT